jgi:catechol 2,3-dioxygenase
VSDRDRTGAWLEHILGLEPLSAGGEWSGYSPAQGKSLVELREEPGARRVPPRGLLGLYHYALLLPTREDLGRFLVHLLELGEPFGGSDHLFSEAIYLTDPDGITVEVYADRPRETWVYRNGDVVGALDPLDHAALRRAAGATRWQGAPRGTRMGHLHFFTGDLAAAERFYVDALGFAPSTRSFPGALFVAAGGYHHHLGLNVWAAGERVADDQDAGLDEWSLRVPSALERAAMVERLTAAGVAFVADGSDLVASDPWGIRVRVEFR